LLRNLGYSSAWARGACLNTWVLIVNSPAYREYLIAKEIPQTKISVVANGVDPRMFHLETSGRNFRREHALDEKFVVMYAGAVGMANDVDCLLSAANRLRSESDVVFAIVGAGKELPRLPQQATAMRLENICFIAPQPKQRVPEALAAADVCVATLKIPMFRTTYPNEVFAYMAAGKPTVLAIDGVIREVIEKSRGGLFLQPGDDEALAQAVLKRRRSPGLRQQMGASARAYVEGHFSRDVQAVEFASVLERVCAD
jgi:glycosyltransferase involved in cell wall biosynthesis